MQDTREVFDTDKHHYDREIILEKCGGILRFFPKFQILSNFLENIVKAPHDRVSFPTYCEISQKEEYSL